MSTIRTFIILLSLFLNSALAEKITVIKIFGLDTISRGTVLNYLPIEVNDEVTDEIKLLARNRLLSTNFFSQVNIEISNSELLLTVKENPKVKYFDIKGFKEDKVLSENINDKIRRNYSLEIGDIFVSDNLDKLIDQLRILYTSNGFYNAKFNIKTSPDEQNRIGIEINIDENDPALISSFSIKGSNYFSEDELLDLFRIGEPDFFLINYFTEKDQFKKIELESGLESIKNKYFENGFLDFSIKNIDIKESSNLSSISINIDISEGVQYKVGNIFFSGDYKESDDSTLKSLFSLKTGDIFKRQSILRSVSKIRGYFENQGYANLKIDTPIKPSKIKESFDVDINIALNSKVYINRIEIRGNTTTQDDVIRRELKIKEGQQYSRKDISESISRVRRLGYFEKVNYEIVELKNDKNFVNLLLEVIPTKTGEFSIGLSHSNASGAAVNAGISQKNILGTGNTFNARFSNSKAVEELSFFFSNPYFTKNGNSISYGAFTKSTDASNLDVSNYILDETGLNFGYGILLDPDSRISSEIRMSNIDLFCGSTFATSDYEAAQCTSDKNIDTTVSLKYSKNTINDFYNPTDGSKTNVLYKLALPIGDYKYSKLESTYSSYFPIFDSSTIKLKSNFLLATGYGGDELPFFKRYYGGGSSSVRGFDFNSLGAVYPDGKAKGGESSILLSSAFISPASKIGVDNENIRVSVFTDAGSINEKISTLDIGDIRVSTGVAASWLTPIGPIGIYFAKPLIKKDGDNTETFSFELGTTF